MIILGIHGGFTLNQHDASATLIIDGVVVAAVEEERLSRVENSKGCLAHFVYRSCSQSC